MPETTDPQELYVDPEDGGCHHFRDPKACDQCAEEQAHDQYIDYRIKMLNIKMLNEAVGNAATAVANAATNLRELVSPAVYDIELAEGSEGADALDDLAAADRLLRNVSRVVRERQRLLKEGY